MKTKPHSTRLLAPLASSICALLAFTTLTPLINGAHSYAEAPRESGAAKVKAPAAPAADSKKIDPRSPEESLATGLTYLLRQQQADGGWGQGGGWRQSKTSRVEDAADRSDLGNTCVAVVTLLRAGQSPAKGEHREAVAKAFDYLCRQVENADTESLYVTDVRDTQLQVKIGTYVDTFLAGWALSELKGQVADEAAEKRRATALDKVMAKIERNQHEDGSFANNNGWAAVISQGLCSKALNLAARSGAKVKQQTLDNAQKQNVAGLDVAKGSFSAPSAAAGEPSSAGVSLYREAAKLNGLLENSRSNVSRKEGAQKTIADASAPAPAKAQAEKDLKQIEADDQATVAANAAVASKLRDTSYVAGFGNNGGEEFLSYMNVTEGVHARGGKDWEDWRSKMTQTVCGAQNEDGSWAGQHCITGRTFCTATALLTLLVEQEKDNGQTSNTHSADAPVAAK
ncbi:MAG: prenyltransferase/squalene oxidase repeat-containing protein [Chthoniobacter sp.]|uniref:prenyltransferase/squalene oxidase repeat-containing protein n=1 Tax=Chthoniobacter sp. TaxID=2510640 RepID=UPI0032A466C3